MILRPESKENEPCEKYWWPSLKPDVLLGPLKELLFAHTVPIPLETTTTHIALLEHQHASYISSF
jgi:hypothetical protein